MGRPTEQKLSPERIADAAIECMDEQHGRFSLTDIARRLGVKSPSLYHYVSGYDDVVELVRERIHVGLGPKLHPEWSWQDAIRHVARSDRDSIGEHPWTAPSIVISTLQAEEPLDSVRVFAGILERAGFQPADVHNIIATVDLLAIGGSLDINSPEFVFDEPARVADDALGRAIRASRSGRARATEAFEFALDRLIESLELRLAAQTAKGSPG